jgi:hypothetical protein
MEIMGIREKQLLVDHLASLQMLLLHDDLWTDAIERESRSSEPNVQAVREIGEHMDALIARAAEAGAYLKSVFAANERAVIEVGGKLGASDRLSSEQREGWLSLVQRAPNAAQLAVRAMELIEREAPRERAQIKGKVEALDRVGKADGDVSAEFKCGVLIGVAIGAGAGGLWPAAFVAGAAAGYECGKAFGPLF